MNAKQRRGVGIRIVLVSLATALAGCSTPTNSGANAPGTGTGTAPESAASSSPTSTALPTAATSTAATPSPTPTFSAKSVRITKVEDEGEVTSLVVTAPANTTFERGEKEIRTACDIESTAGSDPVIYQVSCAGEGPTLFSTIQYGDFEYGFETPIPE